MSFSTFCAVHLHRVRIVLLMQHYECQRLRLVQERKHRVYALYREVLAQRDAITLDQHSGEFA